MSRFVSIDFETANHMPYSACSVALVTVENSVIVDRYHTLIQPPQNLYHKRYSELHGIFPEHTLNAPTFEDVAYDILSRMEFETIVAHNEGFDRSVLKAALTYYDISSRTLKLSKKWECTVKIYRKLGFKPANLKACCNRMNIPLNHHDALSDAEACAILYASYLDNKIV